MLTRHAGSLLELVEPAGETLRKTSYVQDLFGSVRSSPLTWITSKTVQALM